MTWRATALTIFPDMFPGPLGHALSGKALEQRLWSLDTVDLRDFALDRHRSVDDTPFGGGAGMVMRADIVGRAVDAVLERGDDRPLVYLTPRGRPLDQETVEALAAGPGIVALCGRYEGVDQRVIEGRGFREISLGDFVLSGGELAAMTLFDACVRLLPGVVGRPDSLAEESFSAGLLEYPHYTRPQFWEGREVPRVLLSGHHARIDAWRRERALEATRERRPDLLNASPATCPTGDGRRSGTAGMRTS
ncbi:MAG: tRNA (guanosine(37)-N1)-methyltransferase TrmD [Geminicoccaceae bacterium]|nr:tRNA (guanosine(37)-N1)-methyltransferase TrmD [Geminicoccaceae bacterium]